MQITIHRTHRQYTIEMVFNCLNLVSHDFRLALQELSCVMYVLNYVLVIGRRASPYEILLVQCPIADFFGSWSLGE